MTDGVGPASLDLGRVRKVEPLPEDSLRVGSTWNDYRILAVLGRGGMGEVYLAYESFVERYVALKVAPVRTENDPGTQERLRREAAAGVRVQHENVVRVLGGGIHLGKVWVAMEYLGDARTLREIIAAGPLRPADAVVFATFVADALKVIHAADIHHRDLKPENVIVQARGRLKIIDFGLAKVRTSALRTTKAGKMGTPHYMAPEQTDDTLGLVDSRVDVYALGLIIIEMLAGAHPFELQRSERLNKQEVTLRHVLTEPPKIAELFPGLPPRLSELVARMLAKRPAMRPTAEEVAMELRKVTVELDQQRLGYSTTQPTSARPVAPSARPVAPPAVVPPAIVQASPPMTSRGTLKLVPGADSSSPAPPWAAAAASPARPVTASSPPAAVPAQAAARADFLPDTAAWAQRAAHDLATDEHTSTSRNVDSTSAVPLLSTASEQRARRGSAVLGVAAAFLVATAIMVAFWVGRALVGTTEPRAAVSLPSSTPAQADPAPTVLDLAPTTAAAPALPDPMTNPSANAAAPTTAPTLLPFSPAARPPSAPSNSSVTAPPPLAPTATVAASATVAPPPAPSPTSNGGLYFPPKPAASGAP